MERQTQRVWAAVYLLTSFSHLIWSGPQRFTPDFLRRAASHSLVNERRRLAEQPVRPDECSGSKLNPRSSFRQIIADLPPQLLVDQLNAILDRSVIESTTSVIFPITGFLGYISLKRTYNCLNSSANLQKEHDDEFLAPPEILAGTDGCSREIRPPVEN